MLKSATVIAIAACAGLAQGGLEFGQDARDHFASLHNLLNENFLDFESAPTGSNLLPGTDPFGVGARFASILNTAGQPFGPEHVEVSGNHGFATYGNTIVGSPFPSGSDDGRVGYEVRFDEAQRRAGILRAWNTSSLTRFYNAAGDLLVEHQNTTSVEFVGWIADSDDQSTWVARIVMDGLDAGGRQVGYSDDLYFGTMVPSPASACLLAAAGFMRRRRG